MTGKRKKGDNFFKKTGALQDIHTKIHLQPARLQRPLSRLITYARSGLSPPAVIEIRKKAARLIDALGKTSFVSPSVVKK